MDQPVELSLVFPRSGQQLSVSVPRYVALQADRWPAEAVVMINDGKEKPSGEVGSSES